MHWTNINTDANALDLNQFLNNKTYACIDLTHTRKKKHHLLMLEKDNKWNGFKMPLNMKNINNFTQWKNGSIDLTIARANMQQKHLAQSRCSTHCTFSIHFAYLLKVKYFHEAKDWIVLFLKPVVSWNGQFIFYPGILFQPSHKLKKVCPAKLLHIRYYIIFMWMQQASNWHLKLDFLLIAGNNTQSKTYFKSKIEAILI